MDWGLDIPPLNAFSDIDADGIGDLHDGAIDTDHDSIDDRADSYVDSDGDFIPDSMDSMVDRDHDWSDDRHDALIDADGDGVKDGVLTNQAVDPFLDFAPGTGMGTPGLDNLIQQFGMPSPFGG